MRLAGALIFGGILPRLVTTQQTTPPTDSTVVVTVRVQGDSMGITTVAAAIVRSGAISSRNDDRRHATLRLLVVRA